MKTALTVVGMFSAQTQFAENRVAAAKKRLNCLSNMKPNPEHPSEYEECLKDAVKILKREFEKP